MERTRTRGGLSPVTVEWRWNSYPSLSPWSTFTRNNAKGSLSSMTDHTTTNFHKLRRAGIIVNNTMRSLVEIRTGTDAGYKFTHSGGSTGESSSDWMGQHLVGHLLFPSTLALELEADTAAHAAVVKPDVQGMVSVAELAKTLRMLTNPLKGLSDFISKRDLGKLRNYGGGVTGRSVGKRKLTPSGARSAAEASWLEARYGWRPFLKEIESILNALKKPYSPRLTARATRTRSSTLSSTTTGGLGGGFDWPQTVTSVQNVTVRSGVIYEHVLSLEGDFGFTWRDLPSAAWELIPYSFVVDWFINAGSFIEALTPKPGVTSLACWRKVEIETTTTRTTGTATAPAGWVATRSPMGSHTYYTKSVTRVPSLYPPALTFKEGSLRSVLSDLRGLDALALFTSRLLKK